MLTAIVGVNWGDEGKGRMVDLLSSDYDIICRYQGGNNAGHTVVNHKGTFKLNLIPSGILRDEAVNVMGGGMVIDLKHLCGEIAMLREKGIEITPKNLKISHMATICMPYHVLQDVYEEERLADKKFGSTKRGIAPVYADKYAKKALRISDLFVEDSLREKVENIAEWKNLTMASYKKELAEVDALMGWLKTYGDPIKEFVCDTSSFLFDAMDSGKRIMFEAQLGALRDIDYGIYPYTSSSSTLAAYAPIGAGLPGVKIDKTIGIMKAYSSCVGEGPFTVEMFDDEATALREAGGEYGAATGRPRRVGGFDVPASKYGCRVQGADTIALTKLDVLSYLDKIPVCVAYEVDGERTTNFPTGDALNRAKPIFEYVEGFKTDISKCRTVADLPKAALDYVKYIEKAVGFKIEYVSVGPGRDEYIVMD